MFDHRHGRGLRLLVFRVVGLKLPGNVSVDLDGLVRRAAEGEWVRVDPRETFGADRDRFIVAVQPAPALSRWSPAFLAPIPSAVNLPSLANGSCSLSSIRSPDSCSVSGCRPRH